MTVPRRDAEWVDDFLWIAPYGVCFYCSERRDQRPAAYELWFTLSGEMLKDAGNTMLPPHTVLHCVCVPCGAEALLEGEGGGMTLVQARTLRATGAARTER